MKLSLYILGTLVVLLAVAAGVWYFAAPPDAPTPQTAGKIQGTTTYPSEFNPAQTVCAQLTTGTTSAVCVDVPEQTGSQVPTFSITVKPGEYYVYAVIKNPADLGLEESTKAYWTEFVKCGLSLECKDYSKISVTVDSGQTVSDIRPYDWYAH